MMKAPIACSFIVLAANLSAQTETPSLSPSVETLKKNEISLNTAPLFKFLMNTVNEDATRYSVTYKRNLNSHSALRFSLMADKVNRENYYTHPWDEAIIIETDSALYKQITFDVNYTMSHMNLGYERSFGKRKLKWFYGVDLVLGYSKSRSAVENILLKKDTAQGQTVWVEDDTKNWEVVSNTDIKTIRIGMSPFFGAKYPLSKHFMVSAQVGVDMSMDRQEITTTKSGTTNKLNVSNFDFSTQTGILNDISLVYRF